MNKQINDTSKRNPNGEGTISLRADGRYMARFFVDGKRRAIYGKTEKELRRKLREVLGTVEQGSYVPPSAITVDHYLSEWLQSTMKPTIRRSTYFSYDGYVQKHIVPMLGCVKLSQLTQKQLQDFFNYKKEQGRLDGKAGGLSVKTLTNMYNMLHAALEDACTAEPPLLRRNPLSGVKIAKRVKREMRVLSLEEQARIQAAVQQRPEPQAFGIIFALNTGIRIGEMLGLKWTDVDFRRHQFHIRRTIQRLPKQQSLADVPTATKTEIVAGQPKTDSSIRDIPIFDKLWDDLMDYRAKQQLMAQIVGQSYDDQGFIFCNTTGGIIEPRTYEDLYKRTLKLTSITGATFHTLRHTFATRALENGMDVKTLSEILGHSSPSVTLNLYCHALPNHKVSCMSKMEAFYKNSDTEQDYWPAPHLEVVGA